MGGNVEKQVKMEENYRDNERGRGFSEGQDRKLQRDRQKGRSKGLEWVHSNTG